jgi:hypothetical protein
LSFTGKARPAGVENLGAGCRPGTRPPHAGRYIRSAIPGGFAGMLKRGESSTQVNVKITINQGLKMIRFFILPILLMTLAGSPVMSAPATQQNQNSQPRKVTRSKAKRTAKARSVRRSQSRRQSQNAEAVSKAVSKGPIYANSRTRIYYWPTCPDFNKVPVANRVIFGTSEEAEKAGYKAARNCPQ